MAPEDPAVATSLRADRFIIQHPTTAGISTSSAGAGRAGEGPSSLTSPRPGSSSTVPMIVQRSIVDVYDTEDAGWRRPVEGGGGGASGGGGGGGTSGGSSGIGSPAGSGSGSRQKGKGTTRTPDRGDRERMRVGAGGGGRMKTPGSARRERERRRQWSGAERDERDRVSP